MKNKILQYNNVVMVEVPKDETDFMLLTKAGERDFWKLPDDVMNRIDLYANGIFNTPIVHLNLPPGTYSIIGKGDQLNDKDWEGIVDYRSYVIENYEYIAWINYETDQYDLESPTQSGLSLLASKGFKPGEVLILKKDKLIKI